MQAMVILKELKQMSKSNAFETAFLELIFNATTIANIADDASASPAATITVALHTADPGEAGDMSTSEATYTGYARQTVVRTSGGWTVTANAVSPNADILFPVATAGVEIITHASFGSGVGDDMMYSGALTTGDINISPNVAPALDTGTVISED